MNFINAYRGKPPLYLTKTAINLRSLSFSRTKRHARRAELNGQLLSATLGHIVKESTPDCIVSFQAETTHALRPLFPNTPIVTMLHGNPEFYLGNCPVFEIALQESDAVQFLRPEYEDVIKKLAPNTKAVYIPNAIPQFEEVADRSSHTIIHVGRFDPNQKRQDLLIKAFALVKDYYTDWTLELWGEQNLFPAFDADIKKLIAQTRMENRVRLCGVTNHVANELKRASIFAFPSKYEGFPLALGEAMSIGLPAVGWKGCPAVNTLIKNNVNGFLCDETPGSLAKALAKLMVDEDLRVKLGNQAKQDMREYAPSRIWDQWESLLRELIG